MTSLELENIYLEFLKLIEEVIDAYIHELDALNSNIEIFTQTRNHFEPLITIIRRNEKGRWMRLMYEFHDLMQNYYEVEKLFEERSFLIQPRILPSLKTEYDSRKLLEIGRSHQQLTKKNIIMESIALEMTNNAFLMQCIQPFRDTIHHISELTAIEYTKVAAAFRTVLLKKENTTYSQQIYDVAEKLSNCSTRSIKLKYQIPGLNNTPTSPNLFTPNYTPGSIVFPGSLTNQTINHPSSLSNVISNYTEYPDFALIACMSNSNIIISTNAFEIYLRRHFERCGLLHCIVEELDLKYDTNSEIENNNINNVSNSNQIIAIWTHHSLLSFKFINNTYNKLLIETQNCDDENTNNDDLTLSGSINNSNEFKTNNSRLQSILSAFTGYDTSNVDDFIDSSNEPLQISMGICFDTINNCVHNLDSYLIKLDKASNNFPTIPITSDTIILSVIISKYPLKSFKDDIELINLLKIILFKNKEQLKRLDINIISFIIAPSLEINHTGSLSASLVSSTKPFYYYFYNQNTFKSDINEQNHTNEDFKELEFIRNVSISLLNTLELRRLRYFTINCKSSPLPGINIFAGVPKKFCLPTKDQTNSGPRRYFVRILLEHECNEQYFVEQERYFIAALSILESWLSFDQNYLNSQSKAPTSGLHHLLFTTVGILNNKNNGFITTNMAEEAARILIKRYSQRIQHSSLQTIEFRYIQRYSKVTDSHNLIVPIRLVVDNPTGQAIRLRSFIEIKNPTTANGKIFAAINSRQSYLSFTSSGENSKKYIENNHIKHENKPMVIREFASNTSQYETKYDGQSLDVPHPLISKIDQKRAQAAELNTVYIYDFIGLFEEAIRNMWKKCPKYFVTTPLTDCTVQNLDKKTFFDSNDSTAKVKNNSTAFLPEKLIECIELDIDKETGELEFVHREHGLNTQGMVAWYVIMYTPEYPKGRRIILIGNDITHQMGTFGIHEDEIFYKASEYARLLGIPRIFIAGNSGARLGLATEVQKCLRVEFIDAEAPIKGYKYLYVTEDDFKSYNLDKSILFEDIDHPIHGRIKKITDVIGTTNGLGVENLSGSAIIAAETSRSAKSIVTITYCTTRSVGIGAYLARLGHRVIQKMNGAPIVLTGYQALNKVVSREIYSSNDELGGVEIMAKNGVTHLVVRDDLQGCFEILKWLSYVPECYNGRLPIMIDPADPIYRNIKYISTSNTDDPRLMLSGCVDSKGRWLSGFCDKDSFQEYMSDWAKSVIVGRGRIGGIPVGFITVETRVTEYVAPADPTLPNSSELRLIRPGQIWFPDSAYKTAQAIRDFNVEELPLFIIANWRGFSGGQRDMFDAILKYGSFVVDELVNYKYPVFVYIPPKGELRGGAWVVVDTNINPEVIEMYADPTSRGSVLEPNGVIEIKFRTKSLKDWMMRLDPILVSLQNDDKKLHSEGYAIDSVERRAIKENLSKQCSSLLPVYHAAAVHFADLHDTSNRMKAKGVIKDSVEWSKARIFFIHRIKRQLLLFSLRTDIASKLNISKLDAQNIVFKWAYESGIDPENNKQFIQWVCQNSDIIQENISKLSSDIEKQVNIYT